MQAFADSALSSPNDAEALYYCSREFSLSLFYLIGKHNYLFVTASKKSKGYFFVSKSLESTIAFLHFQELMLHTWGLSKGETDSDKFHSPPNGW